MVVKRRSERFIVRIFSSLGLQRRFPVCRLLTVDWRARRRLAQKSTAVQQAIHTISCIPFVRL